MRCVKWEDVDRTLADIAVLVPYVDYFQTWQSINHLAEWAVEQEDEEYRNTYREGKPGSVKEYRFNLMTRLIYHMTGEYEKSKVKEKNG